MNKKEAWEIFNESPQWNSYWENEPEHSGLLLSICSKCGERQTRETYQRGFIVEYYTLIQGEVIYAIAKHKCGQWHRCYG